MSSKPEIALYHPYIDITDGALIKTAALYWDEIQTIVPRSVTDPYQTRISHDAARQGFLKPRVVHPFDAAVEDAGREFHNDITSNSFVSQLVSRIAKTGLARAKTPTTIRDFLLYEEKWSPIYLDKISWRLKDTFPQNIRGRYVALPEMVAGAYMSRLASMISQRDDMAPLTNKSVYQNIVVDRFIDYDQQTQSELARLSLQTVRISAGVPLIDILRFRDNNRKSLMCFRRAVRKMSRQVGTGLNTTKRQVKLKEIIEDGVLPTKEEIEAKLTEGNIAFGFSAFDITQATVVGLIGSQGENVLAGIGAGAVSLAISFVRSIHEDRNIIRDHPMGYLYQAHRRFGVKD